MREDVAEAYLPGTASKVHVYATRHLNHYSIFILYNITGTYRVRMLQMQLRMGGFRPTVVRGCSRIVIASNKSCLLVGHVEGIVFIVCWCRLAVVIGWLDWGVAVLDL